MTATDLTPALPDPAADEAALFDLTTEATPDPVPGTVVGDLTTHAAAVIYQARMLTVADLLMCGPGMCSAVEDLATALDAGRMPALALAAADLLDVTRATEPHRHALDTKPAGPTTCDARGDMYPRDIHAEAPRYAHADRRGPALASIYGMAGLLDPA